MNACKTAIVGVLSGLCLFASPTLAETPTPAPKPAPPSWPALSPPPGPAVPPNTPPAYSPSALFVEPSSMVFKPLRFTVALEMETQWRLADDAQRLWNEESSQAGGLSMSYEGLHVGKDTLLRLDLAYLNLKRSFTHTLSSRQEVTTQALMLGAAIAPTLLRWLSPFVHLAVGGGTDKLRLGTGGWDLQDRAYFLEGRLGAGLALRTTGLRLGSSPDSVAVALAFRLEGGYAVGTDSAFTLSSEATPSAREAIPMSSVEAGTVARRYPYLRLSLGAGF